MHLRYYSLCNNIVYIPVFALFYYQSKKQSYLVVDVWGKVVFLRVVKKRHKIDRYCAADFAQLLRITLETMNNKEVTNLQNGEA